MSAAGIVDPTKVGRYPVILSDALLGKSSSEVYTGLRYNHKPDTPPENAKLRPSNNSNLYDLSYKADGSNAFFKYRGDRTTGDDRYVLIFDPKKEAFVLHKVNSTFNMNLTQTPNNKDADSLKREFPHLKNSGADTSSNNKTKGGATSQGTKELKTQRKKEEPKPAEPKKSRPASDAESSDDDGGLDIEFPGGQAPATNRDFSPAFPPRRFSEFVADADEEEDDADGEEDDDDMSEEHFELPPPVNYQTTSAPAPAQPNTQNQTISLSFDDDSASDEDEEPQPQPQQDADQDDMELDLEAELEDALAAESESDVSEED